MTTPEDRSLWQTGNVSTNGAGPTITDVTRVFDEARAAAFGVVHKAEEVVEEVVAEVEAVVEKVEEKVVPKKASATSKVEAPADTK